MALAFARFKPHWKYFKLVTDFTKLPEAIYSIIIDIPVACPHNDFFTLMTPCHVCSGHYSRELRISLFSLDMCINKSLLYNLSITYKYIFFYSCLKPGQFFLANVYNRVHCTLNLVGTQNSDSVGAMIAYSLKIIKYENMFDQIQ